ncbi:hypothetical protein NPIL_411671 [Nephila pilipes]|uniref:Uncharacterized protein n=1 Tax=Nephila pilipes TaxID=299642 RepID=A0A8X6MEP7_NEPPI|nr:hypothetical protein NPIL_411671 [Nephila pilipes]
MPRHAIVLPLPSTKDMAVRVFHMVKGPLIHTVYGNSQVLRVESDLSTRGSRGRYWHIVIKSRRMHNWTVPFLDWEGFLCRVCVIQQKSWLKPINADRGCPAVEKTKLELASLVCGYDSRYSKARYPVSDEAFCQGFSRDITESNDLRPLGIAIDASQQEDEAVRWWKCSDQIDMDVLKSFNGLSKKLHGAHGMPLDFRSLVSDALSCPFSYVLQHRRPDEAVLDEALCDTNTWTGGIMERAKYFKAKFLRLIRAYFFSTDITEDFKIISHF